MNWIIASLAISGLAVIACAISAALDVFFVDTDDE